VSQASDSCQATAGVPLDVRIELDTTDRTGVLSGVQSPALTNGLEADDTDPDALIADAVEAAREAEIAGFYGPGRRNRPCGNGWTNWHGSPWQRLGWPA